MAAKPPTDDADFYHGLAPRVRRSASTTTGLLCELFGPKRVVDVGCGTGIWLAAFRHEGVAEIIGLDGPWVPRELPAVPKEDVLAHDPTEPLALDRPFVKPRGGRERLQQEPDAAQAQLDPNRGASRRTTRTPPAQIAAPAGPPQAGSDLTRRTPL